MLLSRSANRCRRPRGRVVSHAAPSRAPVPASTQLTRVNRPARMNAAAAAGTSNGRALFTSSFATRPMLKAGKSATISQRAVLRGVPAQQLVGLALQRVPVPGDDRAGDGVRQHIFHI